MGKHGRGRPITYGWNNNITFRCTTDFKHKLWRKYRRWLRLRYRNRKQKPSFSVWLIANLQAHILDGEDNNGTERAEQEKG